jgi:hypothetical protein
MPSHSGTSTPRAECVACFEEAAITGGLLCSEGHLMCAECAVEYCKGFTAERAKLFAHKGSIPCAYRSFSNKVCTSAPFTLAQLTLLQNPTLVATAMQGLLKQALASADMEVIPPPPAVNPAALSAPVAAPIALAKAAPALTAAQLAKETQAASSHLSEHCLFLRCPRCKSFWDDYSGCSALQCSQPTCQQHFCAVCFRRDATSQACHAHVQQAHGGHYQHDKFLAQHRPARTEKVVNFLVSLPNPLVRRSVLLESKALLLQYGLEYQQLFAMLGEDVPKPAAVPAAAPKAGAVLANHQAAAPVYPALPAGLANARVILWLDRRADSNRRLKAHATANAARVISVATPSDAVEWLVAHPRLLITPHRFRIVTNHGSPDNPTVDLRRSGVSASIIDLLADTASDVRLLIFCGASLTAAQQFVTRTMKERALKPGQVVATASDEVVQRFIAFQP